MPQNKITILSTGILPAYLTKEAAASNIEIEIIPFINTEAIQTIEVQQEIEQALLLTSTVVFTSRNAVEAVAIELEGQDPQWTIYCIGYKTRDIAAEHFGEDKIYGVADDASTLADLIIEEGITEEVIFFCGDQRRDELPDLLRSSNIDVTEIVVYQTVAVPKKITGNFQGMLFFSPSAVDAFFKLNKVEKQTVLFAIGNTTSNAIRKFSDNKIIISKIPDKERMIHEVVNYFT
jgi:uroporphyrinogen-III synthase